MNAYETIKQALSTIVGDEVPFTIAPTENIANGDYYSNLAFIIAKDKKSAPLEVATNIRDGLNYKYFDFFRVEVAGPGFINFFLKDDVIRKENEGGVKTFTTKYTGKNILVEHSSPNLFKPFHIGHLMNNIVGEFVTRAVTEGGAHTQVLCFPSDISFGIAKAIYVWKKDKEEGKGPSLDFLSQGHDVEKESELVTYFGECYVRGVALAKDIPEAEVDMRIIAKNLFGKVTGEDYDLWNTARNVNSSYFSSILESIGSQMGEIIYESDVDILGKEIVLQNTGEGKVFTESQGAVVYVPDEDRKDINTAVFINSEGHATYEAKDIGLIQKKFNDYSGENGVDMSFFITDQEQINHFKVVLDSASKLGDEWPERVAKSIHVPHGRMLFKGQKMSSRLGGVPLALDVIGVVEEEVRERAGEKIAHLGIDEKAKLEREIALSALRIAVLRSKPGININFDPETSLSFEGDSGPYLLYTHARCSSLLEKGKEKNIIPHFGVYEVTLLEKKLIHFERELISACEDLAPQKLVTYLFSVAQLFNSYYTSTQILIEGDDVGNAHRLMIVKRVKEVLNRGLHVLGIEAPERM
jgi:arginyl-tRNA synthetase